MRKQGSRDKAQGTRALARPLEPCGLSLLSSRELALEAGLVSSHSSRLSAPRASAGDSVIVIHLGPGQTPEVARILRSEWPTVTALNPNIGPEFHIRMRQHTRTKVCLIYASVDAKAWRRSKPGYPGSLPSIFADVVQRGRVVRTPQQIETAIAEIRRELGIEKPGLLGP